MAKRLTGEYVFDGDITPKIGVNDIATVGTDAAALTSGTAGEECDVLADEI